MKLCIGPLPHPPWRGSNRDGSPRPGQRFPVLIPPRSCAGWLRRASCAAIMLPVVRGYRGRIGSMASCRTFVSECLRTSCGSHLARRRRCKLRGDKCGSARRKRTPYGHRRLVYKGAVRNPAYLLAAPQGFEPRYADPESAVLPLNEGAAGQGFRADARHHV